MSRTCSSCSALISQPDLRNLASGIVTCNCGANVVLTEGEVREGILLFATLVDEMRDKLDFARIAYNDPILTDPIAISAKRLILSMTDEISKVETEKRRAESYDEPVDIERCSKMVSSLLGKIELLKADPKKAFLPLGTVVRFGNASEDLLVGKYSVKSYPAAGTIGVVTGLCLKGRYFLSVSIARDFHDGYSIVQPSPSSFPTYFADPSMLEVVEPGMLPGGVACESYGWIPTHKMKSPKIASKDEDEMIVLADGLYWRLHDFGGLQGIEALQVYESFDSMTWLEDATFERGDATSQPAPGR